MASYTLNDIKAASPGYPTAALERRIHPPCNVKLLFVPDPAERGHPEAMWVTVTAISNGTYTVLLDDIVNIHDLTLGGSSGTQTLSNKQGGWV